MVKFRAWNNLEKKYDKAEDYVIRLTGEIFDRETGEEVYYIDLEQCTGLNDKNGKGVFEGDVVTFMESGGLVEREVYFDTEMLEFGIKKSFALLYCQFSNEFEIIGTIHDQEASSHDA